MPDDSRFTDHDNPPANRRTWRDPHWQHTGYAGHRDYAFLRGSTPETIVEKFPTLSLLDVYTVTAYYLQKRAEIDAYLRQQEAYAESVRQRVERDFPADNLRACLQSLRLRSSHDVDCRRRELR